MNLKQPLFSAINAKKNWLLLLVLIFHHRCGHVFKARIPPQIIEYRICHQLANIAVTMRCGRTQ